ncbi:hypothetical protein HG537_0E03150 [Torulaspora globosa]|uniref:Bis(5'-adenosyl)-triphosphatase n=1 Tax=Torulaspora globosa TaxID=48254 RepID=A0A7H9HUD0_9SACH|nr:hypothetical protein HG537_0E03150 [Torulaspora sp. CBS 2947]
MTGPIYFYKYVVTPQVFFKSKYTYALVNLKPLVPGHVLIVPLRTQVVRLSDLTPDESTDYFNTLQLIQKFISWHFKADSLNIAIQDGPEAGQSVPHLHTHIIPRYRTNNIGDQIYDKLDDWRFQSWDERRNEYLAIGGREGRKKLAKPDDQRIARSDDEMAQEAAELERQLAEFTLTMA